MACNVEQQEEEEEDMGYPDMEDVMGEALNMKQKNTLPIYGNKDTMNINPMILSNIQGSAYFKEDLYKMKTFHEVIDEIFYKVEHLEPWEKGSRKLAGQVGMCGGVRGVAAGGIVSSAYCLLYKLFTLRLTRRQVQAMQNHVDSPYIRGLGFMYIRYCQPPSDLWDWFEPYLDDPEEIDLKAGGGFKTTIGALCRMMLIKLDWFGTMLPRVSVTISKTLQQKLTSVSQPDRPMAGEEEEGGRRENGEPEERERDRPRERERERGRGRGRKDMWGEAARRARPDQPERRERRSPPRRRSSRSRERDRYTQDRRQRSRSRDKERRQSCSRSRDRKRRQSRDRHTRKSRSQSRDRRRRSRSKERRRSRSRSRDRRQRSRTSSRDRKKR